MKRKSCSPAAVPMPTVSCAARPMEQISWEEAIDYIAQEAERIYGEFGPAAVIGTKALAVGKILHQLGGHISLSDTSSIGTYAFNIVALGLPLPGSGRAERPLRQQERRHHRDHGGNPACPRAAPP